MNLKIKDLIRLFVLLLVLSACQQGEKASTSITSEPFGQTPEGDSVTLYTLTNANGVEMKVITYGGIITSLKVPGKEGVMEDVVLGYDNLNKYLESSPYFGALIGRFGNRIDEGTFMLDSQKYELATNNGRNHLHGGVKGFDKVVWNAEEYTKENGVGVKFTRTSPHMEEGYPGNLDVTVTYFLTDDNDLEFEYSATTDRKTVINLTQHSYFNLSSMQEDILNHELMINASKYLPVDSTLIPTGELRPVSGTPFDFTSAKPIGRDIQKENEQLKFGLGFDHCWILDKEEPGEMTLAATLYHPTSGRYMEVHTTEPAIQFYSGNFLDGSNVGKGNVAYKHRTGLCLETQHYPDSPNQPEFPSVVLNPGEKYTTKSIYKFSVR